MFRYLKVNNIVIHYNDPFLLIGRSLPIALMARAYALSLPVKLHKPCFRQPVPLMKHPFKHRINVGGVNLLKYKKDLVL